MELLSSIISTIKGIKDGNIEAVLPKFRLRLRTGWQLGLIQYLSFVIFFSLGIALIFSDRLNARNNASKVKQINQKMIGFEHEPRRKTTQYGIVAAVIAPVEDSLMHDDSNSMHQLSKYENSMTVRTAKIRIPEFTEVISFFNEREPTKNGLNLKNQSLIFKTNKRVNILIPFSELDIPENFKSKLKSFCQDLKKKLNELHDQKLHLDQLESIDILRRCFSDENWKYFLESFKLLEIDEKLGENIPQVFYVGFNGVFSHKVDINSDSDLLEVTMKYPFHKWEASSYVQHFFNEDKTPRSYSSKVYVDISGLGLVRTYSSLVKDDDGYHAGVICFDKKIDIKRLIPNEQKRIEFESLNSVRWDNKVYSYKLQKRKKSDIDYDGLNKVTYTEDENGGVYSVPIQINAQDAHILEISPYVTSQFALLSFHFYLGSFCIFTSILFLFNSIAIATSNAKQSHTANILRNLPIGVLELHTSDHEGEPVKAANDHAEEIFGKVFPRFGDLSVFNDVHYFHELIEDEVIKIDQKGEPNVKVPYSHLMGQDRLKAEVTGYYAKSKTEQKSSTNSQKINSRWYKIVGSPLIDSVSSNISTFGIIELVVDTELISKLDLKFEEGLTITN